MLKRNDFKNKNSKGDKILKRSELLLLLQALK